MKYVAEDGRIFNNKEACERYEANYQFRNGIYAWTRDRKVVENIDDLDKIFFIHFGNEKVLQEYADRHPEYSFTQNADNRIYSMWFVWDEWSNNYIGYDIAGEFAEYWKSVMQDLHDINKKMYNLA